MDASKGNFFKINNYDFVIKILLLNMKVKNHLFIFIFQVSDGGIKFPGKIC